MIGARARIAFAGFGRVADLGDALARRRVRPIETFAEVLSPVRALDPMPPARQTITMLALPSCAYCQAPGADLLTPNGDPVCRGCDAHFRARILDQRASQQAALDPIGAQLTFASPRTLLTVGVLLIVGALGMGVLEVFFLRRVHLVMLGAVFICGFTLVARGMR